MRKKGGKSNVFSTQEFEWGGGIPYKGINPITPGDSNIVIPAKTLIKDLLTILAVPTEAKTVTPSASQKIYTPPAGKYFSKFTVNGDVDLKAENIKEGVNIFGVIGTLKDVTILLTAFECTKYALDKFTLASDINVHQSTYFINHSLGEIPKSAILMSNFESSSDRYYILGGGSFFCNLVNFGRYIHGDYSGKDNGAGLSVVNLEKVSYQSNSSFYLKAGVEYTLITMA